MFLSPQLRTSINFLSYPCRSPQKLHKYVNKLCLTKIIEFIFHGVTSPPLIPPVIAKSLQDVEPHNLSPSGVKSFHRKNNALQLNPKTQKACKQALCMQNRRALSGLNLDNLIQEKAALNRENSYSLVINYHVLETQIRLRLVGRIKMRGVVDKAMEQYSIEHRGE